jgi:hypothetical protein
MTIDIMFVVVLGGIASGSQPLTVIMIVALDAARRHSDHDDRLRQRTGGIATRPLEHAPNHQLSRRCLG